MDGCGRTIAIAGLLTSTVSASAAFVESRSELLLVREDVLFFLGFGGTAGLAGTSGRVPDLSLLALEAACWRLWRTCG